MKSESFPEGAHSSARKVASANSTMGTYGRSGLGSGVWGPHGWWVLAGGALLPAPYLRPVSVGAGASLVTMANTGAHWAAPWHMFSWPPERPRDTVLPIAPGSFGLWHLLTVEGQDGAKTLARQSGTQNCTGGVCGPEPLHRAPVHTGQMDRLL
jgi:hypothetical protein